MLIYRSPVLAALAIAGCVVLDASAQPKRVYIACDDHTDYLWSGDEDTYRAAFLSMIDYYLDLADATAFDPPDLQSRFACDGSFWIWEYEHHKSAAEFARLIHHLCNGHISAPMTALVSCYGGTPAEAVIRGMAYAGSLERRFKLRFDLAVAMENQTQPWGLASLFAGCGARYTWKGICGCHSRVADAWDREHDIYYWQGPDGQQLLTKWNSMLVSNMSMGGYAEARDPFAVVDYVCTDGGFQSRYPFPVIGCFGKGWDDLATYTDEFVRAARALSDSTRRVIVSNELDFFEDFETYHAEGLPSVAYSYGNEWELLCASMAEVSASVKRSVEKLRAAEALAALVTLFRPSFMNGRESARDQAFVDLGLYWEHDWCANGVIPRDERAAFQRRLAAEIAAYVDALHADAVSALGQLVATSGTNPRFFVFNPLGWTRTDRADLDYAGSENVHVVDLTSGSEVPAQVVTAGGPRRLRILATGVPPVGYRVYEIRPGPGQGYEDGASVSGNVIENSHYRLAVADRGAITSLTDKKRGNREFAKLVNGRWINDMGPSAGTLRAIDIGPVSATLEASALQPLQHVTSITLLRDSDRIEISNEITQNFGSVFTYGFGFDLAPPQVRHEEVGAIATARYVTDGGHYATQSARYDWLTLAHFADMTSSTEKGVTLSNADCYYFQLGQSTADALDTNTPQISPLIGGQVDGPGLGIPNQGGDSYFLQRFALRTHDAYDQVAAMRFALEHQNPLVCGLVTAEAARLPPTSTSTLEISNPAVLLWAFKPADDGALYGLVARLWNLAETPQTVTVQLHPGGIQSAKRTTHIETDQASAGHTAAGLTATFARQEMKTFRLLPLQETSGRKGW
ncbi:MAG: glycosyl hydrolase-related protein [Planctomycetota bacterium]